MDEQFSDMNEIQTALDADLEEINKRLGQEKVKNGARVTYFLSKVTEEISPKDEMFNKMLPMLRAILKDEFKINIESASDCENEIFMKAFIHFTNSFIDRESKNKKKTADEMIQIVTSCDFFKHIKKILVTTKFQCLKQSYRSKKPKKKATVNPPSGESGVFVYCPRSHFPNLLKSKPSNKSIFNTKLAETVVEIKKPDSFKLVELLNLPKINWTVTMASLKYERRNPGNTKMFVVNRMLPDMPHLKPLTEQLYYKTTQQSFFKNKPPRIVDKSTLTDYLNKTLLEIDEIQNNSRRDIQLEILSEIMLDLNTSTLDEVSLNYEFQFNSSRYPYVRNYKKQSKSDNDKLDLCLQEVIYPSTIFLTDLNTAVHNLADHFEISFFCAECDVKFDGLLSTMLVMEHYKEKHAEELSPDWECPNCLAQFEMLTLCRERWKHDCHNAERVKTKQKKDFDSKVEAKVTDYQSLTLQELLTRECRLSMSNKQSTEKSLIDLKEKNIKNSPNSYHKLKKEMSGSKSHKNSPQ